MKTKKMDTKSISKYIMVGNNTVKDIEQRLGAEFEPWEVSDLINRGMDAILDKMQREDISGLGQNLITIAGISNALAARCNHLGLRVDSKGRICLPMSFINTLKLIFNIK